MNLNVYLLFVTDLFGSSIHTVGYTLDEQLAIEWQNSALCRYYEELNEVKEIPK